MLCLDGLNPSERLICSVFEQTVEDYVYLKKRKLKKKATNGFVCSILEIEQFLKSQWCETLLEMIDCKKATGVDILKSLEARYV